MNKIVTVFYATVAKKQQLQLMLNQAK